MTRNTGQGHSHCQHIAWGITAMAALQADTPPKAHSQYAGTLCDDNTTLCAMYVEREYWTSGGVGGGCGVIII